MVDTVSLLKKGSLKVTPQRLRLLNEMQIAGHVTIEQLYTTMKIDFPGLSLATVYKNIETLLQEKIVRKVLISIDKDVYEIAHHHHAHGVCIHCGAIVDICIDSEKAKQTVIGTPFKIDSLDMTFQGVCLACQSN